MTLAISSGFTGLGGITLQQTPGLAGDPVNGVPGGASSVAVRWAGAQAVNIYETVVDTATNDATYTVAYSIPAYGLSGSIVYVADSGTTKAEIAAGLALAANNDPDLGAYMTATSDGVDTVTYTGLIPGVAVTMSDADANLTTTETQAESAGSELVFGTACVFGAPSFAETTPQVYPLASILTAQTAEITVVYEAAVEYHVNLTVNGAAYNVVVIADTDDTATAAAIVTALNGVLPANTVLASSALGVVTLTSEIVGMPFAVQVWATEQVSTGSIEVTDASDLKTDDIANVFAGIAQRAMLQANEIGGSADAYQSGKVATVFREGQVYADIPAGESVTPLGTIYAKVSDNTIHLTGGAGLVPLPSALAVAIRADGYGHVAVRVNAPVYVP